MSFEHTTRAVSAHSRTMRRVIRRWIPAAVLGLVTLQLSCGDSKGPTGPKGAADPTTITITPSYSTLAGAPAAEPVRARLTVHDAATNAVLATAEPALPAGGGASSPSLTFKLPLDRTYNVRIAAELLSGSGAAAAVEWSARKDTVITPGRTIALAPLFVRGPLANVGVTSVRVTDPTAPIVEGDSLKLVAVAEPASEQVRFFWFALDGDVATIDATGMVRAQLPGTARFVAVAGLHADTVSVAVTSRPAVLELTPDTVTLTSLEADTVLKLRVLDARGAELTGVPATFTVDDTTVVRLLPESRVRALKNGRAVITVRAGGLRDSTIVTVRQRVVNLTIDPSSLSFTAMGETGQLSARLVDARGHVVPDEIAQLTWSSSNASVVTVSNTGLATARGVGDATITASVDGLSGTASVTVRQAVGAVRVNGSVAPLVSIGETRQFTANVIDGLGTPMARPVTWNTSDASLATVDANGLVTMVGASGTVTISATADGVTGAVNITLQQRGVSFTREAGDAQTDTVGAVLATPLAVRIVDARGNGVSGAQVTWSGAAGSVNPATSVTNAAGIATAVWTLGTTPGAQAASATTTAVAGASAVTFNATAMPGAPALVSKFDGDSATATVNTAVPVAPVVRVTDAFGNSVPNVNVTFAVTSGGGSVTGGTQTTDANGRASVGSWTLGTTAGANTLTATVAGVTPATFTATGTAGAAASISIESGNGGTAAVASLRAIEARVVDAYGNGVQGTTVNWAVATGGGTVSVAAGATDASGVATTTWTFGTTAGTQSVTATAAGLTGSPLTWSVNVTPAPAAQLAIVTQPSTTAQSGVAFTTQPVVELQDAYGNAVAQAGVAVSAAIASGGGTLVGTATVNTDAAGRATFTNLSIGGVVGDRTLWFSAAGLTNGTSNTISLSAGPAAQLDVTTQPAATAQSGFAFETQPTLQLQDAFGNAVSQAGVNVTAAIASGGGTLGGTATVTTNASGVASFTDLAIAGTIGNRTLSFSAAGLTGVTSNVIDVSAGTAAQLALTTQPSATAQSGVAFSTQPTIQVQDANGNAVNAAGRNITAAIASGGGTLGGTISVTTNASGVATFTDLTISGTIGNRTLSFSTAGLTGVTSNTINITAGAAANIAATAGLGQSATVGTAVAVAPQVTITDVSGNPVAGVSVTFAASGNGSVTGSPAITDAAGTATLGSWTLATAVGANTLTATAGALSTTFTATGTVGAPANLAKSAGDGQSATVGSAVAAAPAVTITDQYGNPISGVSVTFAASGDGSVTGSPATTDASGVATLGSWTLATTVGANTLTATAGALSTTFTATGTVGAPANLAKSAGDAQSAAVGSAVATAPAVTITDQYGNPVPGVSVTFAASGDGSVTGSAATTDASGVATLGSWTLRTTIGANTLTVTAGALSTTFTATATVGAPANLAKSAGDGQSATVGSAVLTAPAVTITDQYGNPVAGVSVTFAASADGSVTGSPATTDASGVATPGSWTLATVVGANSLTATAGALSTTFSAIGTVDAPANLVKSAGDGQSVAVGTAVATAPAVTITDQYGNPVAGVSVTFAASGNGSVTGSPATTDASGVATLGSWTVATAAGANTLTATAGALNTAFSATGTVGAPANLAKSGGDAQSATVGSAVATAPAVTITDQYGNPVAGVSVTFAASANGSVTGSPATTDASGVATLGSWTLATAVGANTLTATAGALSTTFTATGTVGAPANLAKSAGDGQSATVGSAVAAAPAVTITDQYGNPISGVSVTFAASGDGSVTGSPATTDASGVATLGSWTLATTVGANTLTATAGALSTTFTATGTVGAPANLVKSAGDAQSAPVGSAVATAPAVTITDQYGNPVPGVSVTFAASGDGSVTGSAATTDASGVATLGSWTLGTTIGANTLTVTAGALSTTFTATATVGAPANLAKSAGDGQSATVGSAVATAPAVTITDQYGNAVAGVSVTFAASADGSVTGSPATTDASGVATLGSWTLATTVGANTLTATAGALSTTFTATGTVGAPANLVKNAGDAQSASVGSAVATAPAVTITDQYGNPVPGVSVTFAASGDGSVTGSAATTDASGVATLGSWTLGTTIGANTLTVTAGALSTTFTATATVGAPANLAKSAGDGQSATVGSAVLTAPAVTITDQYGNPVAGVSVTFAASANGSVTGSPATTDASGVATLGSWTLSTTPGANMLTASGGALSTTFTATGTAGAPAQLLITTQPSDLAQSGIAFGTQPELQLQDAYGNNTAQAGVSITAAIASGGGTLGGTATVNTDANGVATFTNLSITGTIGDRTLSFSAAGLTGATSATINIAAGAPAQLAITTQPAGARSGISMTQQPVLQLQDASGNQVSQSGISVTAAIASGGGTLGGAATVSTDASGVASFTDLAIGGAVGNRTLSFSAGGLTGATSNTITVTAGSPAALFLNVQPSNVIASAPVTPAIQVSVVDAYGNLVGDATDPITIAIGTNPGGSTLSGTTLVSASGGVAVFSNLSLNIVGAGYTLTASSGTLTGATSTGFNVTHGPLDHFLVEAAGGGPIGNQLAGTPFNVRITAQDAFNNTVTSFTGTVGFASTPSGGVSAGAISGAFTAGVLSSHAITFGRAGNFTLTATRTSGTETGTSNSFEVQALPTAVNEGPAGNSAPGQPFHAVYSTSGSPQTFTVSAPGVLSNDNLGFPVASITSFGADSLGGSVTTYAAGSTVSPLPGTGRTTGSLTVNADGSITFTPPDGFTGNYVFRYRLTNARGTSDARVTIAVGERPVATADTYSPVLVGNVPINTANSTQFRVTSNDQGDAKVLAIVGQTNGTATLNADSTFTFRPTPGYEGPASFTYTITNGFGTTAPATVSMTVANPIWFVDAAAPAGGDGRYDAPLNDLAALAAINNGTGNNPANNDRIFLYTGSYTGGLTLRDGQRLIGQGATAALSSIAGVSWPADAGAEPTMSGTAPAITTAVAGTNGINLGNNNTIRGFNIGNVTGSALNANGFSTLTVSQVGINTTGRALNLVNGTISGSFPVLRSTGGMNNVYLAGVATSSTVALGTAADTLSGANGDALRIDGGNGSFIYAGSIANTTSLAVNITGKNGGTVTLAGSINPAVASRGISVGLNSGGTVVNFTGANQRISTGTGNGVSLSSNTGATVNFTGGGLAITTTTGNGFNVTGGGTVTVTGPINTISSVGGVGLNVANTTIGSGGLVFRSISANGGSNGIVLNNTGSTAGLTITGTGSAGSGGTIQNTTGDGLSLTSAVNPSLSYMNVTGNDGSGINATSVSGLSLNALQITNNTDALIEAGVLLTNLSGTNSITNTEVSGSTEDNVRVINNTGTLNSLAFSNCTIRNNSAGSGNVGINVQANNSASMTVSVNNCALNGNRTIALRADAAGTSQLSYTATNNTITAGTGGAPQGNQGIEVSASADAQVTFEVTSNRVGTNGAINQPLGNTGINVFGGNRSTLSGRVTANTVHNAGAGISGFGIRAFSNDTSVIRANINGNTVRNVGLDFGILVEASGADTQVPPPGRGRIEAALISNNVSVLSSALDAIRIQGRHNNTVCSRIAGNTAPSGGSGFFGLVVRQANAATFNIEGLASGPQNGATTGTYLMGQNPAASVDASLVVTNFTGVPTNSCTIPN